MLAKGHQSDTAPEGKLSDLAKHQQGQQHRCPHTCTHLLKQPRLLLEPGPSLSRASRAGEQYHWYKNSMAKEILWINVTQLLSNQCGTLVVASLAEANNGCMIVIGSTHHLRGTAAQGIGLMGHDMHLSPARAEDCRPHSQAQRKHIGWRLRSRISPQNCCCSCCPLMPPAGQS